MFEEQRIKWEGQRGLRVREYWLESGIVETNHRPKAENSKVGLTDSLSEWCHNENLDLQICYDLFTSLAAPRTATIPFSQVLQLISTRSPGWARHRRCLDMDGTTGSLTSMVFSDGGEELKADSWMNLWDWEWLWPGGWARVTRTLETQHCTCACRRCTAPVPQSNSQSFVECREFTSPSIIPSLSTQDHPCPAGQKLLSPKPAKLKVQAEKKIILKPKMNPKNTAEYKRHF